MTGGSLSLTATRGVGQDVININPQITFFKKVYKRHTNFGIEAIQQSLSSTPNFGSSTEINISKSGSLITDMHFEFTLPPAAGEGGIKIGKPSTRIRDAGNTLETTLANTGCVSNFKGYARWVNAVGFAIINEIQLKFGSTILDKHSGLWYDVWNELTDPNRKEWSLVGKFNEDDSNRQTYSDTIKSRYYVPLKFYFNKNPGLALPIFLLNENELKINLSFKSQNSLLLYQKKTIADIVAIAGETTVNARSMSGFKFYANYVFLEADEESRIQNSLPSEYLVETLDIKDNLTTSDVSNLVFENPTKELIWVFRHNSRIAAGSTTNVPIFNNGELNINNINPNDTFNYSRANTNTSLGYGSKDPFSSLTIKINNKERFDRTDATFFRTMQPYKYHSNIPGGISKSKKKQFIYVYSFALNPEEYQPTGSYNFSIGDDLTSFEFQGPDDMASSYDLTIFALRYEYVVFNFGRITVSRVPIQSSFQEAQIGAAKDDAKAAKEEKDSSKKGKAKSKPVSVSSQKNAAVKQEIERRYAVEVPYLHNQSLGKKKWSGLQGDFFQKQQMADLDKEYEAKKKDIF